MGSMWLGLAGTGTEVQNTGAPCVNARMNTGLFIAAAMTLQQ